MSQLDTQELLRLTRNATDNYLARKMEGINTDDCGLKPLHRAIIQAGAERIAQAQRFPSREDLEHHPVSKGDLAHTLYPAPLVLDMALPQSWIDRVNETIPDAINRLAPEGIQFHFVTVYDCANHMTIKPITRQGIDILAELAMHV